MVVWGRCFVCSVHNRAGAQGIGFCVAFLLFRRVWRSVSRRMSEGAAGSNRRLCVRQKMFAM